MAGFRVQDVLTPIVCRPTVDKLGDGEDVSGAFIEVRSTEVSAQGAGAVQPLWRAGLFRWKSPAASAS